MDRKEYMREYQKGYRTKKGRPAKTTPDSEKTLSNEIEQPAKKPMRDRQENRMTDDRLVWAIQTMSQDRRDEILKRINRSQTHDR